MDKIKVVDFYIKKYNKLTFNEYQRLNFLNEFNYNFFALCKLPFSRLFKLYYACFSETNISITHTKIDLISKYLDRIKPKNYSNLYELCNFFNENIMIKKIKNCYINQGSYNDMLEQFNSIGFSENLNLFFKTIFKSDDGKIDFNSYNIFLSFCSDYNKLSFILSIGNLIEFGDYDIDDEAQKIAEKILKKEYPIIIEIIDKIKKRKESIANDEIKFTKNKYKTINILESIKDDIQNDKKVNINRLPNKDNNEFLLAVLLDYNNSFIINDYDNEKQIENELHNKSITNKEVILKKYDFNIDISKISVDDHTLEYKLKTINDYLPNIKKYNNIALKIINKLDIDNFKILIDYVLKGYIDSIFILDNIDLLVDNNELYNFIKNINILNTSGFCIKNIIKFDKSILFTNNDKISNILEKYKEYNIEFSNDIYNFEFLKNDYSYIIDKYIEIGEYKLIKNNPSLIVPSSNNIIKRCIFYKEIDEDIVNEQGKLIGVLRNDNKFPISDSILNESILENYKDLIPTNILNVFDRYKLNSFKKIDIKNIDNEINVLEQFKVNNYSYNIGGMIFSKNKVLRCISAYLNSELKNLINKNEILYYSIIYNYPKLITKDNINYLKNIFEIKIKTLKI